MRFVGMIYSKRDPEILNDSSGRIWLPRLQTPLQGWGIVIVLTQGDASLCPGLTCYAPLGQKKHHTSGQKKHVTLWGDPHIQVW